MDYNAWVVTVPATFTGDPLWRLWAYRLSLFLADVCWDDVTALIRDRRTAAIGDQLYRAVGSIGANIAEGYSRGTGRDRARFYEYALGSAREARDWYYKARHVLGNTVITERMELIEGVVRLLLVMVPNQRALQVREDPAVYEVPDPPLTHDA